jgi:hypothetical protein
MSLPDDFNGTRKPPPRIPAYVRPGGTAAEILPLDVYDTPALGGFEQTLEEAIFILSQSPTARRLAAAATSGDYGIVIMEEDPDSNLRGYVDHEQRLIFLAKEEDPRLLALTLGHELTHVSQKINGGIDVNVRNDRPLDAIYKLLAMEADARAHEMLIAAELSYPAHKTADQISFPEIIDLAAGKSENSFVKALLQHVRPRIEDRTVATDKFLTACFKGFYGDIGLRMTYENVIVRKLASYDTQDFQNPAHFQNTLDAATLAKNIDAHSIVYLAKNKAHVDLAAPLFRAVSAQTMDVLKQVQDIRRKNSVTAPEADWYAPGFADIAVPKNAPAPAPKCAQPKSAKP